MIQLRSILSLLVLSSSLLAQEAAEPEAAKPAANAVAVEDVVDDNAIERRLNSILQTRERDDEVDVEVESGAVTFDGFRPAQ